METSSASLANVFAGLTIDRIPDLFYILVFIICLYINCVVFLRRFKDPS